MLSGDWFSKIALNSYIYDTVVTTEAKADGPRKTACFLLQGRARLPYNQALLLRLTLK